MREIKFRAWDYDLRYMTEVISLDFREKLITAWNDSPIDFDDKNVRLMQYTGLKDSKGVDIYEGDIVNGAYMDKPRAVTYSTPLARFTIGNKFNFTALEQNDLIVVGNIYENPELLEGV